MSRLSKRNSTRIAHRNGLQNAARGIVGIVAPWGTGLLCPRKYFMLSGATLFTRDEVFKLGLEPLTGLNNEILDSAKQRRCVLVMLMAPEFWPD